MKAHLAQASTRNISYLKVARNGVKIISSLYQLTLL